MGNDYMCLHQRFVTTPYMKSLNQPSRFRELFDTANLYTRKFPIGFYRYITSYWKVSNEGEAMWKNERNTVTRLLRAAPNHTNQAVIAAVLTKVLVDVVFEARGDFKKAAKLLAPASLKVPEAGLCPAAARLLAKLAMWVDVVEQLELHLRYFPDDSDAATMLGQAKQFAKKNEL